MVRPPRGAVALSTGAALVRSFCVHLQGMPPGRTGLHSAACAHSTTSCSSQNLVAHLCHQNRVNGHLFYHPSHIPLCHSQDPQTGGWEARPRRACELRSGGLGGHAERGSSRDRHDSAPACDAGCTQVRALPGRAQVKKKGTDYVWR